MTAPRPASTAELEAMARACELAARGAGTALPNPVVGCVLLAPTGEIVGEGFHERPGGPHAEVSALAVAGSRARGATAVVTLEPCNHTGRTGPCSDALVAAGVARVVVAVRDPWPPAAGGIERLRAAGVEVVDLSVDAGGAGGAGGPASVEAPVSAAAQDVSPLAVSRMTLFARGFAARAGGASGEWTVSEIGAAARDVNRVWLGSVAHGRPFVTLKTAMSLDGRVAAPDGSSRWISSPESRADAHRMRTEIDTIMVGVGTVLADDPRLTARGPDGAPHGRQPLRVVVDTRGRTPADAKVRDSSAPTLVATEQEFGVGPDGRVDLAALLTALYRDGRRHVLVEGGPRLAASFLDAGLVDELLVYLAPLLLGAGRSALEGGALTTLADAHRADLAEIRVLGPDLALRYRLREGG